MVSPMSCNSNFVQYFLNRQRRSLKVESGGPRGKVDHSKIKYWELHNLHKNAIKYAAPEAHFKSNLKLRDKSNMCGLEINVEVNCEAMSCCLHVTANFV